MHKLLTLTALMLSTMGLAAEAVDLELQRAFTEDQAARSNGGVLDFCGDEVRRRRIFELMAGGKLQTLDAKYMAAMILQHTPQGMRDGRIVSASPENYLLAHYLAVGAAEGGHKGARYLAAATIDRFLVSQGLPQKKNMEPNSP